MKMEYSINYIKRCLDEDPTCYSDVQHQEELIEYWISQVKGDYTDLFEIYRYLSKKHFSDYIVYQFWTELISVCPSLDSFSSLLGLISRGDLEKDLWSRGISLCKTNSDIDYIERCFKEKYENIRQAIQTKRDELSKQ